MSLTLPQSNFYTPRPVLATLRQIAGWDLEHLNAPFEIKASVPALQRGLVWSPRQVELLWDSILRGFPIGCLVVSARLDSQERGKRMGVTHHLLDGQQRCNAITLGFHDSFSDISGEVSGNESKSILWIDIAPEGIPNAPADYEVGHSKIPANSTREFLTRVTTMAHPWGYAPDDNAGPLSASDSRNALKWVFTERQKHRPHPKELLPWVSNAPVPMAWLLEAATNSSEAQEFWSQVIQRLEVQDNLLAQMKMKNHWTQLALFKLKANSQADSLERIHLAVRRVLETQTVILEAPADIIASTRQESGHTHPAATNISNIEHLFHRLNRQGTMLDGEELAYSLIKAYWPKVANVVEEVELRQVRRVPAAKLVALAIRAGLTNPDDNKLARGFSITRLRAIAHNTKEEDQETRERIEAFIGCGESGAGSQRIAAACTRVDSWLVYHPENHPHGLPPVLVSSIARNSPDCYAMLLHLADRLGNISEVDDRDWKQWMPGIATLLHWFAKPGEQLKIVDGMLASVRGELSALALVGGFRAQIDRLIYTPPRDDLQSSLDLPADASLAQWRWWSEVTDPEQNVSGHQRQTKWWPLFERTKSSREMLLYAQRSFLSEKFSEYDPSRRDLWADHNRPWDFDHLHASAYFYNAKSGVYADVCREWGNCIGNLRAWPFEDNRSQSKETLERKLAGDPQHLAWSFVDPKDVGAFSHGDSARHDLKAAHALCMAIKVRYLAIYDAWYMSARIREVIGLQTQA